MLINYSCNFLKWTHRTLPLKTVVWALRIQISFNISPDVILNEPPLRPPPPRGGPCTQAPSYTPLHCPDLKCKAFYVFVLFSQHNWIVLDNSVCSREKTIVPQERCPVLAWTLKVMRRYAACLKLNAPEKVTIWKMSPPVQYTITQIAANYIVFVCLNIWM